MCTALVNIHLRTGEVCIDPCGNLFIDVSSSVNADREEDDATPPLQDNTSTEVSSNPENWPVGLK